MQAFTRKLSIFLSRKLWLHYFKSYLVYLPNKSLFINVSVSIDLTITLQLILEKSLKMNSLAYNKCSPFAKRMPRVNFVSSWLNLQSWLLYFWKLNEGHWTNVKNETFSYTFSISKIVCRKLFKQNRKFGNYLLLIRIVSMINC